MFSKIMCPVDLSEKSLVALKKAVEIAKLSSCSLVVLNVHEEFMDHHEMIMLRVSEQHFAELQRERAVASRQRMQEMAVEADGADLEIEYLLREGKPHREITQTAQELDVDLIVMATDGRSGVGERFLGSNAERVVRGAHCSVFAVRE